MGSKKSILFIANPISGSNQKEDLHQLIKDNLDHSKFVFDFIKTEYRGHATELSAQAARENIDIVIACGGDGTVNEVAKPLVQTKVTMGIIPNGSGNGFAMHIGMGRSSKKAIHILNEATSHLIDTCTVNDNFFLNLAGVGFDALVAYKIDHGKKRGFQLYVSTISKELFKFKAQSYSIKTDDKLIKGKFTIVAVANAAMYGYNFTIAPKAELSDGLLDIVLIKEASLVKTILGSWRMLNKTLHKSKLVDIIKSKEVIISTDSAYYYHIDGESQKFDSQLHFKLVPASLNMLFPKDSQLV